MSSPVSCQSLGWLTDQLQLAAVYVALQCRSPAMNTYSTFNMFCTAVTWTMTNISVMLDFALSPANFARDSVRVQTIFTACKAVLFISAGLSMIIQTTFL